MRKYKIYIRWGGLMEDPIFRWEFHGIGEGHTPEEACDELYKHRCNDTYDSTSKTDWGMKLGYEDDNEEIRFFSG